MEVKREGFNPFLFHLIIVHVAQMVEQQLFQNILFSLIILVLGKDLSTIGIDIFYF